MGSDLQAAARACLETAGLRGASLAVAVSGGPDSIALLRCLAALRGELGLRLHVAHLNHGLRGAQAQADARYVRQAARRLGLPCTIGSADVAAARRRGEPLEQAARRLRYGFLAAVARDCGARAVALGHTADDQAETVLLHLARGAGLDGLAAMRPVDPWPFPEQAATELAVVRPLLTATRREVESYCRRLGLRPRRDLTNESLEFRRNIVRHRALPALARVNPRATEAIARAASLLRADADYLREQAQQAFAQAVREHPWGLELDRAALASLPPAILGRVIHQALCRIGPGEVAAHHVETLASACGGPAGAQLSLPGGAIGYVDYRAILLGQGDKLPAPLPPLPTATVLAVPGETQVGAWRCRAAPEPPGGQPCESPWTARLDAAQAGTSLVLRARRPGDRFQPLGLGRPQKLQDFFVNARVPRRWRDRVPLVVAPSIGSGRAGERIAWVAGYRIAHWARVAPATKIVLRLELVRA